VARKGQSSASYDAFKETVDLPLLHTYTALVLPADPGYASHENNFQSLSSPNW